MKRVCFGLILLVSFCSTTFSRDGSRADGEPFARLGIKGDIVFIVKGLAPFASNSPLRIGDIITGITIPTTENPGTQNCSEFVSLENLQATVLKIPVGSLVDVDYLRPNSGAGSFSSNRAQLRTIAFPSTSPRAGLGLSLEMGLMIRAIDSSTPQESIAISDILVSTIQFGQLIDLTKFVEAVKKSKFRTLDAEVYKYSSNNGLTRSNVSLTVYRAPVARAQPAHQASLLNVNAVRA